MDLRESSSKLSVLASNLVFALGLTMALIGAGVFHILPGAGLGGRPLWILFIVAGACLAIGAGWRRRNGLLIALTRRRRGSVLRALAITLITLLMLEFILTATGAPTYYPAALSEAPISYAPWWTCDEAGGHYVYDGARQACENGELAGGPCKVNRQAFPDAEDFVMTEADGAEARILVLGDSFAFGPLLRPRLTVLAFYTNDFDDNLLPLDTWLNAVDAEGMAINMQKYSVDEGENVIALDLRAIRLLAIYGKAPPHNDMEYRLGLTRLGALALQLIDKLREATAPPERFDRRLEATRRNLRDLSKRASEQDSALLALLIPAPEDLKSAGRRYYLLMQLMEELGVPNVNLRGLLDRDADHQPAPDFHWNNAGRQKVGRFLGNCIAVFIISAGLADCAGVIVTADGD